MSFEEVWTASWCAMGWIGCREVTSLMRAEITGRPNTGRRASFEACVRTGRLNSMPCAGSPRKAAVNPLRYPSQYLLGKLIACSEF